MLEITFDTNLLIDIEEKRAGHKNILQIIELHKLGKVKICIPASSASEKLKKDGERLKNYKEFEEYLKNLGIVDYETIMAIALFDVSYMDNCLLTDDGEEALELEYEIGKILFPNIEPEYREYCLKRGIELNNDTKVVDHKWLNAKLDAQNLWCHIYKNKDIFLTRDMNFLVKSRKLCKMISPC